MIRSTLSLPARLHRPGCSRLICSTPPNLRSASVSSTPLRSTLASRSLSSLSGGEPTKHTIALLKQLFQKDNIQETTRQKKENLEAMQKLYLNDSDQNAAKPNNTEKEVTPWLDEIPVSIGESYKHATKFQRRSMWKQEPGSILYWYCLNMSFNKSDFERVLPTPDQWSQPYAVDNFEFDVVRSRNPLNLTRWLGYYLIFPSLEAAKLYKKETEGADLSGLELKLRYVNRSAPGLRLSILEKFPQLPRNHCALILGLPDYISNTHLLRTLWDYDLFDDDDLAIERLPKGLVKYGGDPVLLRFNNEQDAYRLMRQYNNRAFPNTDQQVFVEVLD